MEYIRVKIGSVTLAVVNWKNKKNQTSTPGVSNFAVKSIEILHSVRYPQHNHQRKFS